MTRAGPALTDAKGMTLYTYDGDARGVSRCAGICAVVWPPAEAARSAGPIGRLSVITRPDGSKQWAYDGAPLYGYVRDAKPGDVNGEGAEGVWHLAKP